MKKREQATKTVVFMHRAGHEPSNRNSLQDLVDKLHEYEAKDAGLTLDEWKSLPESEQIRLREDCEDRKYAIDNRMTLEEYRTRQRARIEGQAFEEAGYPQWLRDQLAAENPVRVAVEYANLTGAGQVAVGKELKQIILQIKARIGMGQPPPGPPVGDFESYWHRLPCETTFAEAKQLLLEEIERARLGEFYREAVSQQRERAKR
jgi:hypothetical protein